MDEQRRQQLVESGFNLLTPSFFTQETATNHVTDLNERIKGYFAKEIANTQQCKPPFQPPFSMEQRAPFEYGLNIERYNPDSLFTSEIVQQYRPHPQYQPSEPHHVTHEAQYVPSHMMLQRRDLEEIEDEEEIESEEERSICDTNNPVHCVNCKEARHLHAFVCVFPEDCIYESKPGFICSMCSNENGKMKLCYSYGDGFYLSETEEDGIYSFGPIDRLITTKYNKEMTIRYNQYRPQDTAAMAEQSAPTTLGSYMKNVEYEVPPRQRNKTTTRSTGHSHTRRKKGNAVASNRKHITPFENEDDEKRGRFWVLSPDSSLDES